jgi:hypothetical protein
VSEDDEVLVLFWALLTSSKGRRSFHDFDYIAVTPITLLRPLQRSILTKLQGTKCKGRGTTMAVEGRRKEGRKEVEAAET